MAQPSENPAAFSEHRAWLLGQHSSPSPCCLLLPWTRDAQPERGGQAEPLAELSSTNVSVERSVSHLRAGAGVLSLNSVLSTPGYPSPAPALLPAVALNSRTVSVYCVILDSPSWISPRFWLPFSGPVSGEWAQSIGVCNTGGTSCSTGLCGTLAPHSRWAGGCQPGFCLPSPSLSLTGIPSPREEPQSRASGILQEQSQAPFQAGAGSGSPAGRWQLLACGMRECPLANWEAAHYVMRTEAGELRELRRALHATQIFSSSPVYGTAKAPSTGAGAWP